MTKIRGTEVMPTFVFVTVDWNLRIEADSQDKAYRELEKTILLFEVEYQLKLPPLKEWTLSTRY